MVSYTEYKHLTQAHFHQVFERQRRQKKQKTNSAERTQANLGMSATYPATTCVVELLMWVERFEIDEEPPAAG